MEPKIVMFNVSSWRPYWNSRWRPVHWSDLLDPPIFELSMSKYPCMQNFKLSAGCEHLEQFLLHISPTKYRCKLRSTGRLSARARSNRRHSGEASKTMDYISVFTNLCLELQQNRSWIKGLGKNPFTHSIPFTHSLCLSSNVCHSHDWRVDTASGKTLKKQNACLHGLRSEGVKEHTVNSTLQYWFSQVKYKALQLVVM